MMELLIPLGLLGLLGIVALIIIYIIKPNYQTKHISSTYVWKLSLKYRKKRLPTSRVRNIILFLCQLFILASMAVILAQPAIVHNNDTGEIDAIAIIDSSASMYAGANGDTRFSRAVDKAKALSDETVAAGGYMSVILADADPAFLARRVSKKDESLLSDTFDAIEDEEIVCSYGQSDIDAALGLSEEVLAENPSAKIYIFTDTVYNYIPENVTVETVGEKGEWNAAILSVTSELVDGYYSITVEVAYYGDANKNITVSLDVAGVENDRLVSVSHSIDCNEESVKTLIFREGGGEDSEDVIYYDLGSSDRFYTYRSLHVSLDVDDDFATDDDFYLYDGQKETVKVLYASTDPNPFFTSALDTMKQLFSARWNLQVDEVPKGQAFPQAGYDFYIYEHTAPDALPTDGVVFLADPDRAPSGSGLRIRNIVDTGGNMVSCDTWTAHPVTRYLIPEYIQVSRYTIFDYDSDYEAILSVGSAPLLLVQNDGSTQIAVMPFSVHYSNIAMQPEWLLLIYNLFDYFLPATVDGTAFEVNQEIVLNARGPRVTYSDEEDPIEEFPAMLSFSNPGTYVLEQELFYANKDPVYVNIFVRIPRTESNIWAEIDNLEDPYKEEIVGSSYEDLLVYLAAALVALLFVEWILHSREGR